MTPPCNQCNAACCKLGAHGWSGSYPGRPFVNGRCEFLMRDDRCSIYDARPQACRTFDCRERDDFKAKMGAGPWSEA